MSAVLETSGINNLIWVAGQFLSRDPLPIQLTAQRFETKTRMSNAGLQVDRLMVDEGWPNVMTRLALSLPWPNVVEPSLLNHLTSLSSMGQPFDVVVWKQEDDFFDGDGTTKTFYLQRRVVGPVFYSLVGSAVTDYGDYPLRATRFSASFGTAGVTETTVTGVKVIYKTAATIDTGNPAADEVWIEEDGHAQGNLLLTKTRWGTAPADGNDTARITYIPLMRMLVDSDSGRTFEAARTMSRAFRLIEQ